MGKLLWVLVAVVLVFGKWVGGFFEFNETEIFYTGAEAYGYFNESKPFNNALMVGLTLIQGARARGAVCLDGTLPGYHLHRGYGSGANSWLIQLEGGGWCNNIRNCVYRKKTRRGSSRYMEKLVPFMGILSNKPQENPDFFNWNRVKLRYCDGGSFAGDSENKAAQLQFRGQRIWLSAMEDLMSKGMHYANQALLSGCSAGGLASILHCDEFRNMFPRTTRVKVDVSGGRTLRNSTVVWWACRIQSSLAPPSADRHGYWSECRKNHAKCSASQIRFLQERQDTWFADNSPVLRNKAIAIAVGDWYFDRSGVKAIDCPYPCDKTCHNLVFR
ncbi:hypothetical protein GH714_006674 [Hevea brasiliensis]|uniref:Pectin acetylesterase n=1 Tax=Hevea brasiliensis TaxID=3981 RepID=A0A6A6NG64_HEVBR|nr:hypothetical protein GH714_006674 [Hevea brasiliensis]